MRFRFVFGDAVSRHTETHVSTCGVHDSADVWRSSSSSRWLGISIRAPIGAPGAFDKQHEAIQQRKRDVEVSGENAKLKSSGPADLTVLRYGDFASTTIAGERVPQDANFLMDRRLFDNNFSSDAPITESQFYFHLPKKETQKIIRF